ncbi:hypothetical protein DN402_16495 [Streptomyces sp. SW4]|nr:hypothetical protein DN402_16495 [Streptomyces sp. SW4]
MAVVTDAWRDDGRIEVWDVRRGTRVARLEGDPLDYGGWRWVVFAPDGDRLAALDEQQRVVWWRVDEEKAAAPGRAIGDATGLLGVAPDGTLVVTRVGDAGLYSPDGGEPLGLLSGVGYDILAARITGDTLVLVTDKADRRIRLSPDAWYDTLCAALDGPNSPAQRGRPELEPARDTPPCPAG